MAGESQETPGSAPDPTVLTTEQLMREMSSVEREFALRQETRQREIKALKELVETLISALADVTAEEFRSVKTQFELIERQRVEQKSDTKAAVDAALIAQKEAVQEQTTASGLSIAKSEAATAKQLDQLSTTFTTAISGVTTTSNDQKDSNNIVFGDLKDRIAKIEVAVSNLASRQVGAQETRSDSRAGTSLMVAVAGTFMLALSIGLAVASLFLGK